MAGRLKQPSCGGRDCTDTCAPTITGGACVSRTGSANLRGWSRFANPNGGDWNTLKHTRYDQSGDVKMCGHSAATMGCARGLSDTDQYFAKREILSGFASWDVATNAGDFTAASLIIKFWRRSVDGGVGDCSADGGSSSSSAAIDDIILNSAVCCDSSDDVTAGNVDAGSLPDFQPCTPLWDFSIADLIKTAAGKGCVEIAVPGSDCASCGGSTEPSLTTSGSMSVALAVPDTVAAAQARGSPTVGSSCQTLPGTVGSTTARSTTQIALGSATRSVVRSIDCGNLIVGHDYEITCTLTRRASADDAFISTDAVVVNFTADGVTDTAYYPVPNETGVKVNFDSADSIVEV